MVSCPECVYTFSSIDSLLAISDESYSAMTSSSQILSEEVLRDVVELQGKEIIRLKAELRAAEVRTWLYLTSEISLR